jgi:type III secretion protein J
LTLRRSVCDTSRVGRALIAAMIVLASACSTTLEEDLPERDADEVIVTLADHGIGATKQSSRGAGGFDVVVLESDVARALAVLRDEDLPRDEDAIDDALEPSLIPTAGEERARFARITAAELARTIETLDGVRSARVHLGLPDPTVIPIDETPPAASASVLVRSIDGAAIDEAAILALVAGAVAGLSPEHVAIVVRPMPPPAEHATLEHVGPIAVTAGSASTLRLVLAATLLVNVALAIVVGAVLMRRR